MNRVRWRWSGVREAPHHDAGLQAERTAMAWQRTALGVGGIAALLLHQTGGSLLRALPGLIGFVVATALLVLTEVHYERTVAHLEAGDEVGPYLASPTLVRGLAVTVSALAVAAVGLVLLQG